MNSYNLRKTSRKTITCAFAFVAMACLAYPVWRALAAAGDLDPTFGGDGKLDKYDFPFIFGGGSIRTAIQADGKILVLERREFLSFYIGSGFDFYRINQNGSLDTSFDGDGYVNTNLGSTDLAKDLVIQPDGKIIVAGVGEIPYIGSPPKLALVRYNPNGSLDTTFDGDGKKLGPENTKAYDVELQPNGKIIVYGVRNISIMEEQEGSTFLARFNTNGSLDTSFGDAANPGYKYIVGTKYYGFPLAIQSDGKILVKGNVGAAECVTRQQVNGALDTSFGAGGVVCKDGYISAIKPNKNGKIMILTGAGIWRLNADGTDDASFGTSGFAPNSPAVGYNAMAIQEDGRLIVAGYRTGQTYPQTAVCRHLPNGMLDTSFGSQQGCKVESFSDSFGVYFSDVLLQADGRIIASGKSLPKAAGCCDPLVRRYKNDNTDTQTTDVAVGTITISPSFVYPGTVVTYNVPVKNNSATKAAHVTLNATVPSGTSFFGIVLPAGWAVMAKPSPGAMGAISCSAYELAPNTTTTVQIQVAVSPLAYSGQNVFFSATVGNTIPDTTINNFAFKAFTVQ